VQGYLFSRPVAADAVPALLVQLDRRIADLRRSRAGVSAAA
jgi:hypothetical protein